MKSSPNYETEAIKLSKAIDIAIEAIQKFPPANFSQKNIDHFIKCYLDFKNDALNPEPKYKKIASLKYTIEAVFTFFNESDGQFAEYFWHQVQIEKLGYIREDKLRKILMRDKIKGRIEFDYVTDIIVIAEQEKRITEKEREKLNSMLLEYENRKK